MVYKGSEIQDGNLSLLTEKNNSKYDCGSIDDYLEYKSFEWLVEGVLFSIVGIIGFLGNTLSILVLISPQVIDCNPYKAGYGPDPTNISSQSSSEFDWWSVEALWKYTFNRLLVALAIFDLIFVLTTVPIHAFTVFQYSNWLFVKTYDKLLYPFSSISLSASIFMTVSLTVERYYAVCKPTEYRNAGLVQNKNIRVAKYLVPVIVASVLLNLPKFVETSVGYDEFTGEVQYNISSHRLDPTFIWYYTTFYSFHPLITTELGPIIILASLNIIIFRTFSKNKRRFSVHGGGGRGGHGELNLARIILNIVAVFVICHIPRSILAVLAVATVETPVNCMEHNGAYYPPAYILYSETVSHLLLITNSSVNFLIYCVVATRFRVFIKRMVMCNSNELTSNPPLAVGSLITAPLLVMTAVPHQEPIAIIQRRRCESGSSSCSTREGSEGCGQCQALTEPNIHHMELFVIADGMERSESVLRERSGTTMSTL